MWEEARTACQGAAGDLVVVNSLQENGFLKNQMSSSHHWIGLNDKVQEGQWRWLDQQTDPEYTNWNIGEPNNAGNTQADCVYMYPQSYRKGRWNAESCVINAGYICELPLVSNGSSCADGWRSYDSSCYYISSNATTWSKARRKCQQLGADLARIESDAEQNYVKTMFSKASWIGLNDRVIRGTWVWLDDTEATQYNNWYRNEPSAGLARAYDCVVAHSSEHNLGRWSNIECSKESGYICEIPSDCSGTNSSWISYNGHCYNFNVDATSWSDARSRCHLQRADSDLVKIETREEQTFINGHISGKSLVRGFWLGLNSQYMSGIYKWLNESTKVIFTNWDTQQPSQSVKELCVEMYGTGWSRRGKWNDEYCMKDNGFICQMPAAGDTSYFDFKLNNSVYKIVDQVFARDVGRSHCQEIMGQGAGLLRIESEEEFDTIGAELTVRFATMATQFWIDGDTTDDDIYKSWGQEGPFGVNPTSSPGRRCISITPQRGAAKRPFSGATGYVYKMFPRTCCEEKMIVCEKHIEDSSSVHYDFLYNGSIYKFSTETVLSHDAADRSCQTLLDGGGGLLIIESDDELAAVSAEVRVRHLGDDLEYWIYGDGQDGNLTYTDFTGKPAKDEHCLMLAYNDDQGIVGKRNTLDITPVVCDGRKRFVCERALDLPGVGVDPNAKVTDPPQSAQVVDVGPQNAPPVGCVGPCIGLAIAFPFGIILAVLVTAVVLIYWRRRSPFGFFFNKDSDQVYLTA